MPSASQGLAAFCISESVLARTSCTRKALGEGRSMTKRIPTFRQNSIASSHRASYYTKIIRLESPLQRFCPDLQHRIGSRIDQQCETVEDTIEEHAPDNARRARDGLRHQIKTV